MSDNVDFYKNFIFTLPREGTIIAATAATGIVLGITSFLLVGALTVTPDPFFLIAAPFLFYLIPAFLSAEGMTVIGRVRRRFTYLNAIIDQVVVFLFAVILLATSTFGEAWQIFWLGLATIYLINLLYTSLIRGRGKYPLNLLLPLIFPLTLLLFFHLTIGRSIGIPGQAYIQNLSFFIASGFLLLLTLGIYQFIIDANVEDVSVYDFFSTIITGEKRYIKGSMNVDVPHQAFHIQQDDRELTYNIPWLHPGPVAGFGGGRLTTELIQRDDGFMLHVPSYHTLDLSNPEDIDRFQEPPDATTHETATELMKRESGDFTIWGRRYGDRVILYLQNRQIDDYDPAITYSIKEQHPDLTLVDLHNQPVGADHDWIQTLDTSIDRLKDTVADLVQELEDAKDYSYSAGFYSDDEHACLVEKVNGQTTCLLTVDGNDAPESLLSMEDRLDHDHVLVSTTDSHEKLVELADPKDLGTETLEASVEQAEQRVDSAAAGLGERTVEEVEVMGKNYEGLIFTLNIMGRLVPISLLLYYIGLIFLIL
ncbi:MAG: DUF2070 family protein [Candidatus Nanohaloarchaea archaeon]|nr:DUF2070 family protein [Candidatus Nanohaloarchaea archaeon]